MSAHLNYRPARFSDRVLSLLNRVEHRSARTRAEIEAVYRIRAEAASFRGLPPDADGRYDGALDNAPNAWVTTTFIDGGLASTLRIHVAHDESDPLPSIGVFSDIVTPYVQEGHTIIDTSELVARLDYSRRFPEMPYIALRPAWLAAEYFDADFIIMTVGEEHQAFYQRVFGYEPWCGPRPYPDLMSDMSCMGLDFRSVKERVEAKYFFLRSSQSERRGLFGRWAPSRPVLASSR